MIQTLDDVIQERQWNNFIGAEKIVERIKNRLAKRLPPGREVALTALQKEALNRPIFWQNGDKPLHLIIQGATSAGKTLLSEISVIDVLCHNQKAIILVPLKAMVHERYEQFKEDIVNTVNNDRIYGSSSDYLDNDELLINGEYDVAIIVYEKFFAMLSQPNCRILNNCSLIVVDELSMLSKEERGPKLEMTLEVVRSRCPDARIMCLATCDCGIEKISGWLGVKPEARIYSTLRPVGLDEYIISYDGTYSHRYIPNEVEQDVAELATPKVVSPDDTQVVGRLEVPGYHRDLREADRKRRLLLAVLKDIYQKRSKAKVLVFVSTRSDSAIIAKYLLENAEELFPPVSLNAEFYNHVLNCDMEEDQRHVVDMLLRHGIVYHNAGLSTAYRELIEEEFQSQMSPLKVVVATETLTIGVNLPFDAIIMTSFRIPSGTGEWKALTNQEYRNYIGRAGRLGQNNHRGISYLFVADNHERNVYWSAYYQKYQEIESALIGADEGKLAPYYLALLMDNNAGNGAKINTTFDEERLSDLHKNSLSNQCRPRSFEAKKLLDSLEEANLAGHGLGFLKKKYELRPFGKRLAPYALSLDTCMRIYYYFYQNEPDGLPNNVTQEDIDDDRYLLEILYHVCCHDEIAHSSSISYPFENLRTALRAGTLIKKALKRILSETDDDGHPLRTLWCGEGMDLKDNELYAMLHEANLPAEDFMLNAAMRAVLLFYWTQGKKINEIQTLTEFSSFIRISNGDLERLAEVVSFHLDAIYRCISDIDCPSGSLSVNAQQAFYSLQVRVKYGMPRNLTQLANKHIHGLDRAHILDFGNEAAKRDVSPVQLLYIMSSRAIVEYMTPSQRNLLLERLERSSHTSRFDILMDKMSHEVSFTPEQQEALSFIFDMNQNNIFAEDFWGKFSELLKNEAFFGFRSLEFRDNIMVVWSFDDFRDRSRKEYYLIFLQKNVSKETAVRMAAFFEEGRRKSSPCMLIYTSDDLLDSFGDRYDFAMHHIFFAFILAGTLQLQKNGAVALSDFFEDAQGIFGEYAYTDFSLSNYLPRDVDEEAIEPSYRILYSKHSKAFESESFDMTALINDLCNIQELKNSEGLSWGNALMKNLERFAQRPTLILVKRSQIVRSKSLLKFLYLMQNQNFQNCMVLFASEESCTAWMEKSAPGDPQQNVWRDQFNRISYKIVGKLQDAVNSIRIWLGGWQHNGFLIGVSYAHFDPEQRTLTPEEESAWKSDTQLLDELVQALKEQYGEHIILYDKFPTATHLFPFNGSVKRSLDAYRQCRLYLILWNYWTVRSESCKKEREVIHERCGNEDACSIWLTASHQFLPRQLPISSTFEVPLGATQSERKKLLEEIHSRVEKFLLKDGPQ